MPRTMIGDPRTRKAWANAIRRCTDPTHAAFPYYGGRGIVMYERWRRSFAAFLADMGACPEGYSLDRLDPGGGYAPGNCRWATKIEQANNTRANRHLTHEGQTRTVAEWAHALGVPPWALFNRLYRGWSVERTMTTPLEPMVVQTLTHARETLTLSEWAARVGVTKNTLIGRLDRGWPLDKALACGKFRGGKTLTLNGVTRTVPEWAAALGLRDKAIYRRLANGWPVERVLARH